MRLWHNARKALAMALLAGGIAGTAAIERGVLASEVDVEGISTQIVDMNQPMLRAIWIDTWNRGMLSPEQCEELVEQVRAANLNAIIPEVRKVGDAYYLNGLEPMATNIEGPDDWDPLQYLIDLCHDTSDGKQRIEVHAWLVTLRLWRPSMGEPPEGHLFHEHPETIMLTDTGESVGGNSMFADPGHPMTIEWTANVFRDVAERYDIDGIHHDYVRYPEHFDVGDWGHNPVSLERFRARTGFEGTPEGRDPAWRHWRRQQVTDLTRRVYAEVQEANPNVLVSAATLNWALEMDIWEWQESSPRLNAHQDWVRWMQEGTLDLNVLMNYTREQDQPYRFNDWTELALRSRNDRHAIIGPGAYLNTVDDTIRISRAAMAAGADGIAFYAWNRTNSEGVPRAEFFERIRDELYTEPVPPSTRPWKETPNYGTVLGQVTIDGEWADGAMVTLNGAESQLADGTGFFAFFRVAPGENAVRVILPDGSVETHHVEVEAGLATRANFEL